MEVSDIVDNLKRYPIAWGAGMLSLAIGGYLYFTMESLKTYEDQVFELEREVQTLKSNARQGADIEQDYDAFRKLFDRIDSSLMDHTQIANNNGVFYTFASNHPVEITAVSQRPVIEESNAPPKGDIWSKKHFSVIPFSMEVNGLLTDIADMFYQFDKVPQLIEIRRFELTTTLKPEEGYMAMTLEVNVLGKPLKAATPEGGSS